MEYCKKIITLVGVTDEFANQLENIGGCVVRSPLNQKEWNDVQFKTHKLRMTVDGFSIRNTITRKYVRVPYESVSPTDLRLRGRYPRALAICRRCGFRSPLFALEAPHEYGSW